MGRETTLNAAPESAEFESIRRRLGITVRPGEDGTCPLSTPECTYDPIGFGVGVDQACERMLRLGDAQTTCAAALAESEARLCAANTFVSIIDSVSPQEIALRFTANTFTTVLVPPQDSESNSELSRLAQAAAAEAVRISLDGLVGSECSAVELQALSRDGEDGLTVADDLAYSFREAYEIATEAQARLIANGAAVSDNAYSSQTDTAEAAHDALAPMASRTAAAHALIGGAFGLPAIDGVSEEGFFTRSRLSGEGQRAIQLIRSAAIDPVLLSDTSEDGPSIDELIAGGGSVATQDSIRFRLGWMQSRETLRDASSADAAYELLGVTRGGFLEARELLREEIRAFDRSGEVVVDPEPLPDGSTTFDQGIVLYAATRVAPQQHLPSYWSTIVRFDPTPAAHGAGLIGDLPAWLLTPDPAGGVAPGDTFGTESVLGDPSAVHGSRTGGALLDQAHRGGAAALEFLCPMGTCRPGLERAASVVAQIIGDLGPNPSLDGSAIDSRYANTAYLGRARACWYSGSGTAVDRVRLQVELDVPPAELLVVRGRAGLECAVRGTFEGVLCSQAFWDSVQVTATDWVASPSPQPGVYTTFEGELTDGPTAGTDMVFVVRRTTPVPSGPIDAPDAPLIGGYDELVGFLLPEPSLDGAPSGYCIGSVISPRLDQQAAELIQPSTTPPYRPAESCAGLPTDMRIPLENELTANGDGVESSWRHYLALAEQAAAEADALGEDVIRTGLEMDSRAEAAADELSNLCGVPINLSSIAQTLREDSVARLDGSPPCSLPYTQQGDLCVLDPVLYAVTQADRNADMGRLAACLGTDLVPWSTLGDQPLCIWDANGEEVGGACVGATPEAPCPYLPSADGICDPASVPVAADPISVNTTLGLFTRPSDGSRFPDPGVIADAPCDALARFRAGTGNGEDGLRATRFMMYDKLSRHASNLTWEASVGDRSLVRYGGRILAGTGSFAGGSGTRWPMDVAPSPELCPTTVSTDPVTHLGPLFCLQGLASEGRLARARTNDLLQRAVLALRIFTGTGTRGLVLPYYSSAIADVSPVPGTFSYRSVSPDDQALCADSGTVRTTAATGAFGDRELGESGRACLVLGVSTTPGTSCVQIPEGAEWSLCPHDGGDCVVFDDVPDCDDAVYPDNDMPLILRPVDSSLDVPGAELVAAREWNELVLPQLLEAPQWDYDDARRQVAVSAPRALSEYFTTWNDRGWFEGNGDDFRLFDNPEARLQQGGNLAYASQRHLTVEDLFNGIELACIGAQVGGSQRADPCDTSLSVESVSDVYELEAYLECQADLVSEQGSSAIVAGLPSRIAEAIRSNGTALVATGSGELDAEVAELRAALLELSSLQSSAASDLRAYSALIRDLNATLRQSDRTRRIEELLEEGRLFSRLTECVTAFSSVPGLDLARAAGAAAGAAAICANAFAQLQLEQTVADLQEANVEDEVLRTFARVDGESAVFVERMAQRSLEVRTAFSRIEAALARLRANQSRARRALARALLLDDDGMATHMAVNTSYRARYNTQLQRYRRAHTRAVRAAYIARIALEQRLGMPLADIEDDVFGDEAPREWVDTVCTLPSIDYDSIRMATPGDTGEREGDTVDFAGPTDYSGAYVGDYVRRLQQVFESYSFVHPFQEGTDTAVVSLREDVFSSRAPCEVRSSNLLANGGRLDVRAASQRRGWAIEGCDLSAVPPETLEKVCVDVDRLGEGESNPYAADPRQPDIAPGYRLVFGEPPIAGPDVRLEQRVEVGAGRYRVSWFELDNGAAPTQRVQLWDSSDAPIGASALFHETRSAGVGWRRVWFFAEVAASGEVAVVIPSEGAGSGFELAGVMMEVVTGLIVGDVLAEDRSGGFSGPPLEARRGQRAAPPPFSEGGDLGLTTLRTCADETGAYFRREAWTRDCVRICRDGYDGNCPDEWAETRCFRQTSFDISSDRLQRILVAGDAGFAAGNYNYRIESVGVNLVGTGLRQCDSGSSGCFASGSFSYSMLHLGPFLVRNARGNLYDAPLFPGRIESARALAAERYLTNPLSGADRGLVEPYVRAEFQGRPLGGTLILRLWEDERFNFDRLEDVQVLLNYRYWQHRKCSPRPVLTGSRARARIVGRLGGRDVGARAAEARDPSPVPWTRSSLSARAA